MSSLRTPAPVSQISIENQYRKPVSQNRLRASRFIHRIATLFS
jgi:hypothetical protein